VQAARARQEERAAFAADHAAQLFPVLSRIEIRVARRAAGEAVLLDGVALDDSAAKTAFPVDPGEHTVGATAPGRTPWRTTASVQSGPSTLALDVPELAPAPALRPSEPPAGGDLATSSGPSARRILGWSAIGVAAVGVGLGSYFGVRAFSSKSDGERLCHGSACPQSGLDLLSDAKVSANVSTVAFAAGLGAGVLGIYLLLTDRAPHDGGRGTRVEPLVAGGTQGVAIEGTW
jgi:serine/threonine-protein kinase